VSFIILLGIVSLFGDVTYEGARSVTGPYLFTLGASPGVVSLLAGAGEFIGYALRLASGYVADRTKAYWLLTFVGYGLILSIPLLGFAGYWQLAVVLIILERVGKAIRNPARDTMLSYATKKVGRGWGFAVHEALDQIGAIIGPVAFSLVLLFHGTYQEGFTFLWIPAVLTLAVLAVARKKFPSPQKFETPEEASKQNTRTKLPRVFWLYTAFTLLSMAGFANFQLISLHLKAQAIVPDAQIPIIYAIAMAVDAVAALVVGRTYDRIGLASLLASPLLTLPIPFFAFSTSYRSVLIGMGLWGAVLGFQETIMRAAIADLTPVERRGFAYGIFNTALGAGWALGGAVMGLLYEHSIEYLILFAVIMELISIPVLFMVRRAASLSPK
jgi:predicted MFS family arabinose efflux permease